MADTYKLEKTCEVCGTPIPDDFGNLLCSKHYEAAEKEKARIEAESKEERERAKTEEEKQAEKEAVTVVNPTGQNPTDSVAAAYKLYKENGHDASIKEDGYTENPEAPDKDQVVTNMVQFLKSGQFLYHESRSMYNTVKDYCIEKTKSHAQFDKHIWKPHIVDVGCGSGVGTNILSQEADFAWGIDKNELSIKFANEAFKRDKNGVYYSSQLSYDIVDITEDERQMMQFDVVVAIEIIEHIEDYHTFLKQIITKFSRREKKGEYKTETHKGKTIPFYTGTDFFISTPNRNHPKLSDVRPKNKYHVREWTSGEFLAVMKDYFEEVVLMDVKGNPVSESEHETTTVTPLLAQCRKPKI